MRRKPLTKKVLRGLECWIPAISILSEQPDDSELQHNTDEELEAMKEAIDWISELVHAKQKKAARGEVTA